MKKTTRLMKRLVIAGLMTGLAGTATGQDQPRPDRPVRGGGLLAVLDLNGNGTLEAEEIDMAVVSLRKLDRDEDGAVSPEELRAAMGGPGRPGPGGDRPDRPRPDGGPRQPGLPPFERLDRDGDGKISREEAPEAMKERFDRIDQNGDGFIDQAEHEEVARRLRERVRQRGDRPGGRPGGAPDRRDGEGGTERPARPEPKDR